MEAYTNLNSNINQNSNQIWSDLTVFVCSKIVHFICSNCPVQESVTLNINYYICGYWFILNIFVSFLYSYNSNIWLSLSNTWYISQKEPEIFENWQQTWPLFAKKNTDK